MLRKPIKSDNSIKIGKLIRSRMNCWVHHNWIALVEEVFPFQVEKRWHQCTGPTPPKMILFRQPEGAHRAPIFVLGCIKEGVKVYVIFRYYFAFHYCLLWSPISSCREAVNVFIWSWTVVMFRSESGIGITVDRAMYSPLGGEKHHLSA